MNREQDIFPVAVFVFWLIRNAVRVEHADILRILRKRGERKKPRVILHVEDRLLLELIQFTDKLEQRYGFALVSQLRS